MLGSRSAPGYLRVDLARLSGQMELESARAALRIRWWVLPLAALLCGLQARLNIIFEHSGPSWYLIATQISVIAFALLVVGVLALNPLMRLAQFLLPWLPAPLNRGELMAVFAALFVSGGISSFGLADQLIPLIAAPFNPAWNTPQRGWAKDLLPHLNPALYIADTEVIRRFRSGFDTDEGLWRKIPWLVWARPISLWMVFVLGIYLMFYSLSMLFHGSWANREKLVFPLARLSESMLHDQEDPPGSLPRDMRSLLFWAGFGGVFLLLGYNALCQSGVINALKPLSLGLDQNTLRSMLAHTIFDGIADGGRQYLVFLIIFTAVGIGYLLPIEVSRSLWVYHALALVSMMAAIWSAVHSSSRAFSSDMIMENNYLTSLGGGGLLALSGIYVCQLLRGHWQDAGREAGGGVWGRARAFFGRIGWGGALFAVAACTVIGWLAWNRIAVHWSLMFLAVIVLVTIGLMRVMAEGGVYWFQINTGPFHLVRLGGGATLVPASVLAALMPIYAVLFYDIKTFMAPAVINSFKMQEEARAARRRFHAVVIVCILTTVVVSLTALLLLVYNVGANKSSRWFFTGGPQTVLNQAQRLASGSIPPPEPAHAVFYLLGGAWVVLSVLMRRRFFWWLQPIGFVMLANPLMSQLWFGIFLGSCAKKIATKYGGRHTFARLRPFFLGLILGELMASFFWAVLAHWLELPYVKIDINRMLP